VVLSSSVGAPAGGYFLLSRAQPETGVGGGGCGEGVTWGLGCEGSVIFGLFREQRVSPPPGRSLGWGEVLGESVWGWQLDRLDKSDPLLTLGFAVAYLSYRQRRWPG
jgi:hypothetical protein